MATKQPSGNSPSDYCSPSETAALLAQSAQARQKRLVAADMVTTERAAEIAGVSRTTMVNWITKGRAIGLTQTKRGFMLPQWQFEPKTWEVLEQLSKALGVKEGWALLSFLESPLGGLGGITPRVAIEQGEGERVLLLAQHCD